jgi:hypothetical protein
MSACFPALRDNHVNAIASWANPLATTNSTQRTANPSPTRNAVRSSLATLFGNAVSKIEITGKDAMAT